jgi:hypothetical protein
MLKRVAIGVVVVFILLVLGGTLLQVLDPDGVRERRLAAEAPAPTATARLVLPTPTSFATRTPTQTATRVPTATPVPLPKIGDDARIEVEGIERLPLAVDEKAMDDLSKASTAHDNIGLRPSVPCRGWHQGARHRPEHRDVARARLGRPRGRPCWLVIDAQPQADHALSSPLCSPLRQLLTAVPLAEEGEPVQPFARRDPLI